MYSPGSDDKTVKVWNVYTGEILNSLDLEAEVKFVKVISENNHAVVSCNLGYIAVIDLTYNVLLHKLEINTSE